MPTTYVGAIAYYQKNPAAREIALRFPIALSRAYARLQKEYRSKVVYPNQFRKLCQEKNLPFRAVYAPADYQLLKDVLQGGSLVTAEIRVYDPDEEEDEDEAKKDDKKAESSLPEEITAYASLYHYNSTTGEMHSFFITAHPEVAVREMVRYILPMENGRYLLRPIATKSSLAILSPLDPLSLNSVLTYLLEWGYDVRVLGGNDFGMLDLSRLELLREIQTVNVSYYTPEETIVPAAAEEREFAQLFQEKVKEFPQRLTAQLRALGKKVGAHYLVVLQPFGKHPFARGFDLRRGELVWRQDQFAEKSDNPGLRIAAMVSEMQRVGPQIAKEELEQIVAEKDRVSAQRDTGGLARVAILDFYDRTRSPLYNWLSVSLSSAVNDSMQRIFEFERTEEKKSNEAGAKLFAGGKNLTLKTLQAFQTELDADYLILGFYSLNPKNGNVIIESKVYDLVKKKEIGGKVLESTVDVQLFNAVDEIASGVVQDILQMTQQGK
ncbi:MAG: hypothetical protein NZL89_05310 [Leptospiraceae bacterium]|nr:hypothetical protein [Leptospiraceae bacterium]